jgi:hypothetical protein
MKRLDGWEPVERTRVTAYDQQGRPAAWETRRETEWDPRERRWMLALALYEAGLCQKCGQSLDHTTDPNTDPDRPDATQQWIADGPFECFCCKALVRAERKLSDDENSGGIEQWSIHSPVLIAKKPRRRRRRT